MLETLTLFLAGKQTKPPMHIPANMPCTRYRHLAPSIRMRSDARLSSSRPSGSWEPDTPACGLLHDSKSLRQPKHSCLIVVTTLFPCVCDILLYPCELSAGVIMTQTATVTAFSCVRRSPTADILFFVQVPCKVHYMVIPTASYYLFLKKKRNSEYGNERWEIHHPLKISKFKTNQSTRRCSTMPPSARMHPLGTSRRS